MDAPAPAAAVAAAAVELAGWLTRDAPQTEPDPARLGALEALAPHGAPWHHSCQWQQDPRVPAGAAGPRLVLAGPGPVPDVGESPAFVYTRGNGAGADVLVATPCGSACLVAAGAVASSIAAVVRAFGGTLSPVPAEPDGLLLAGLQFLQGHRGQQLTAQVGPAWSCMWRAHAS